jgi:hypothetical protein
VEEGQAKWLPRWWSWSWLSLEAALFLLISTASEPDPTSSRTYVLVSEDMLWPCTGLYCIEASDSRWYREFQKLSAYLNLRAPRLQPDVFHTIPSITERCFYLTALTMIIMH